MYKNYKDPVARSLYMKEYSKKYRLKNKTKIKEYSKIYNRRYKLNHKDKIAALQKRFHQSQTYKNYKNSQKYKMYRKQYRTTISAKYGRYKYGANKRGYEFQITKEEFSSIISMKCHYCGTCDSIGIDRKDNSVGYKMTNCLPCCFSCNKFKRSMSYEYFIEKCKSISSFVVKKGG